MIKRTHKQYLYVNIYIYIYIYIYLPGSCPQHYPPSLYPHSGVSRTLPRTGRSRCPESSVSSHFLASMKIIHTNKRIKNVSCIYLIKFKYGIIIIHIVYLLLVKPRLKTPGLERGVDQRHPGVVVDPVFLAPV